MIKDIPIHNQEVLDILNKYLWFYENLDILKEGVHMNGEGLDAKDWVSEQYLNRVMSMGTSHDGFPEKVKSYNFKPERMMFRDKEKSIGLVKKYDELNSEFMNYLSTKNCALAVLYPPGGFISWHNNANASSYNLIFSWSETGDGYFQYVDGDTGETVKLQDKKGWQCKSGYFGHYGEHQSKLCYHSAKTDCWRMTVSFIFDRTDMSHGIQDDVIEDIMTEI